MDQHYSSIGNYITINIGNVLQKIAVGSYMFTYDLHNSNTAHTFLLFKQSLKILSLFFKDIIWIDILFCSWIYVS